MHSAIYTLAALAAMIAVSAAGTCTCSDCSPLSCVGFTNMCNAFANGVSGTTACTEDSTSAVCGGLSCDALATNDCVDNCRGRGCSTSTTDCAESNVCFPATATVQLESGKVVTMDKLQIGDRVLVAPGEYSEVYLFTHRLPEATAEVVKLTTLRGDKQLRLTPNHYVYVNGTLAAAHVVRPGDNVTLADGTQTTVASVAREMADGLFNPHTLHGDVVVDGIITSTYTQGIAPALAHAALWPVRALYQAGVDVAEDQFASGSQALSDLLPNGRNRY